MSAKCVRVAHAPSRAGFGALANTSGGAREKKSAPARAAVPAREARALPIRRARPLLGTFVEVTVAGFGEDEANSAINAAFEVIAEVQRRMSFHDPASALSELNRCGFREAVEVDEWTFAVLEAAEEMWRVSDGVFDVTVAPRLQRLGFLPQQPSPAKADEDRLPSFADVELSRSARRVRFHHPRVQLDLGGIAKGYAVDRATEALRARGIGRALVNAGGDLRALGSSPVAIRSPSDPAQPLAHLTLTEAALATSAHYFADRLVPGAALGPILHPRTGAAASALQSATVRARSAMLADALTKVVMLRGEAALPVLDHFNAAAIFVVTTGGVLCSPRWDAALHLSS